MVVVVVVVVMVFLLHEKLRPPRMLASTAVVSQLKEMPSRPYMLAMVLVVAVGLGLQGGVDDGQASRL